MPATGTWKIRIGTFSGGSQTWTPTAPHALTGSFVLSGVSATMPGNPVPTTGTCKLTVPDTIFLNGSTAPTAFASLPAGFTFAAAWVFGPAGSTLHSGTDANTLRFQLLGAFDFTLSGLTILTSNFVPGSGQDQALTGLTNLILFGTIGLDITFTGHGETAVNPAVVVNVSGSPMELSGTYTIVGYTWYFNPTNGQFQLAASAPGAPWRAQVAGTFTPPTDPGSGGNWTPADPNEPAPTITAVTSAHTYTAGVAGNFIEPAVGCSGTTIHLIGTGFGNGAVVAIGALAATGVVVVNSTLITCVVPAQADAVYDVSVQNPDGQADTYPQGYTYLTPWWLKTLTYTVNGHSITYYRYVQQCTPPSDEVWTYSDDGPDLTTNPNGWYMSPSAFGGDVVVVSGAAPADPRAWAKITTWAASARAMLGGSPAASATRLNRLIYPGNTYTLGTNNPPIRVFDGVFDREIARVPNTAAGAVPNAVVSMLAANGTIYFTTHDSGTTSATWAGRVFSLDLETGQIAQIGADFTAGDLPYALAWHMGRLWVGTNNGIGTLGKVYWFRPGIDTAWTLDYTLTSSSVGGVCALVSFNGLLYVASDAAAATFAKVLVRATDGTYSTSDTGTGGTARLSNGFLALRVFAGALYATYWNNDTTAVAKIRKYDGSSWSTVYTGAAGTLRPLIVLFEDDDVLFAIAGCGAGLTLTGIILSTPDGTTWTNLTANLPEATRTLLPIVGVELL